jgi:4-diphosphocytidyl-2-C-methyl-D-erythritol kinase
MRIAVVGSQVVVRAPAKVNLFLEVLAKRADGYHDIATLMLAVRLYDTLVFAAQNGEPSLECNRADLSVGPDNLVLKAARLLQEKTGCQRGVRIRLVKRIPMAAGLAGGSTDAAATLVGLNKLWGLGRSDAELAQWSGEIGSDIPFFFHTPAAFCTGRGEKVAPQMVGRALDLVLVCPKEGLSTAAVYRTTILPDKPLSGEEICRALAAGDVNAVGRLLHNRLQTPAEKLNPTVARWQQRLGQLGALGQMMSGSGSSLFALCRDRSHAESIAQDVRIEAEKEQAIVFLVRSCS